MDFSKMSDAELRHRRKVQSAVGRTTSTLGLTGLGITGAAALASRNKGALRAVRKIPGLKAATPEKMRNTAINTGIVSGGIGGVGGFNQASIYSAEAKRRKPVTKGLDVGYYGEVGKAKEWKPSASKFDAERSRQKRAQAYETGAGAASGGLAAGAGIKGAQAGKLLLRNRKTPQRALNLPNVKAGQAARKAAAVGHGKVGAALAGGSALAGATALAVRNRSGSESWRPYAKRSAFGVEHDPVSKAINIKPENKGKFTALAHKKGKGVQEAAHAIVGSSKATELQRKRAQFAINAKKWHH